MLAASHKHADLNTLDLFTEQDLQAVAEVDIMSNKRSNTRNMHSVPRPVAVQKLRELAKNERRELSSLCGVLLEWGLLRITRGTSLSEMLQELKQTEAAGGSGQPQKPEGGGSSRPQ